MSLKAAELRAINHYCIENNLKPALSTYPMMGFNSKETGERSEVHITGLISIYNSWNEEDKKKRARERALEKASEKIRSRKK